MSDPSPKILFPDGEIVETKVDAKIPEWQRKIDDIEEEWRIWSRRIASLRAAITDLDEDTTSSRKALTRAKSAAVSLREALQEFGRIQIKKT